MGESGSAVSGAPSNVAGQPGKRSFDAAARGLEAVHEIDDGLTDEERAALVEEEATGNTETDTPPADAEAAAEAAAAAETDPPKVDDAAAAAAAATEEVETTEAPQQSAPILVAPPPEDATAKLAEIDSKKDALLTQFDDGDITAREYQKQLDALAKEERSIERAQDRAELAAKGAAAGYDLSGVMGV